MRSFGDAVEIGEFHRQRVRRAGMAAEHDDRQIAEAHVVGEHRQERLDDARSKTFADHHAVDIARIERARGALDAERADDADPLADRDRQFRIGAAAPGDQHGRLVERIACRQIRQRLAARGERAHAAQHRAVERADAQRRAQPPHQARRRRARGDRQGIRDRRRAVVAQCAR